MGFVKACLQSPVEFIDLTNDTFETIDTYPIIKDLGTEELLEYFTPLKQDTVFQNVGNRIEYKRY